MADLKDMEEQNKATEEQKKASELIKDKLEHKKIVLNRKINYSIIRYMWDNIKGYVDSNYYSSKDMIGLYDTFRIGRTRYNRIVYSDDNIKLDKDALFLQRETGVEKEIFNGKKAFEVDGISRDEWKEHFDLATLRRKMKQGDYIKEEDVEASLFKYKGHLEIDTDGKINIKESVKKLDEIKKVFVGRLKEILRNGKYDIDKNRNLFLIHYYIVKGKAYDVSNSIEILSRNLDKITWEEIMTASDDRLQEFINALSEKLKLAEAAEILKRNAR